MERLKPHASIVWAILVAVCTSQFVLLPDLPLSYPFIQVDVSEECMRALNRTVNCPELFLRKVVKYEGIEWDPEYLSEGCTNECSSSLGEWVKDVETACDDEESQIEVIVQKSLVRPVAIPMLFQWKYRLLCLKNEGEWCTVQSQLWKGSDFPRYRRDICSTEFDDPNCFEGAWHPGVVRRDDERLSTLYDQTMVCSDCFLQILHERLQSPFLHHGEWTDYLIRQHEDLQIFCSTTMPLTPQVNTLYLGPMSTDIPVAATTTATTTTTTGVTKPTECPGQTINPRNKSSITCRWLAEMFGVATGELRFLTGREDCNSTGPLCTSFPCDVRQTEAGDTCTSLASDTGLSLVQFMAWNPRIMGTCDNLVPGQHVCMGPPGDFYTVPSPLKMGSQMTGYRLKAAPALPTPPGTIEHCGKYYEVNTGETCAMVALLNGITMMEFRAMNLHLDWDCTNLWPKYSYCVAELSERGLCGDGGCHQKQNEVSRNGKCGPDHGHKICDAGSCCSIYGFCGTSEEHCGIGNCYSGACTIEVGGPSLDGTCGPRFPGNFVCEGTAFGECCSDEGYCGDGAGYCD